MKKRFSLDLDFGNFTISKEEIKALNNDPNLLFDFIYNNDNPKVHSFILEETETSTLQYFVGSFGNGKFLKTIINQTNNNSKTFDNLNIAGITIPITLIGKTKDDRFIFNLNSEVLNQLTEEQKATISDDIPASYFDDNPILLIGKVRILKIYSSMSNKNSRRATLQKKKNPIKGVF